jgi:phosphogluconate dehydratase
LTSAGRRLSPDGEIVDERAIVNAIVGLHATGGSTNHTIHLVAIARAAGIFIDWDDFDDAVARGAAAGARLSQWARPT